MVLDPLEKINDLEYQMGFKYKFSTDDDFHYYLNIIYNHSPHLQYSYGPFPKMIIEDKLQDFIKVHKKIVARAILDILP